MCVCVCVCVYHLSLYTVPFRPHWAGFAGFAGFAVRFRGTIVFVYAY